MVNLIALGASSSFPKAFAALWRGASGAALIKWYFISALLLPLSVAIVSVLARKVTIERKQLQIDAAFSIAWCLTFCAYLAFVTVRYVTP